MCAGWALTKLDARAALTNQRLARNLLKVRRTQSSKLVHICRLPFAVVYLAPESKIGL